MSKNRDKEPAKDEEDARQKTTVEDPTEFAGIMDGACASDKGREKRASDGILSANVLPTATEPNVDYAGIHSSPSAPAMASEERQELRQATRELQRRDIAAKKSAGRQSVATPAGVVASCQQRLPRHSFPTEKFGRIPSPSVLTSSTVKHREFPSREFRQSEGQEPGSFAHARISTTRAAASEKNSAAGQPDFPSHKSRRSVGQGPTLSAARPEAVSEQDNATEYPEFSSKNFRRSDGHGSGAFAHIRLSTASPVDCEQVMKEEDQVVNDGFIVEATLVPENNEEQYPTSELVTAEPAPPESPARAKSGKLICLVVALVLGLVAVSGVVCGSGMCGNYEEEEPHKNVTVPPLWLIGETADTNTEFENALANLGPYQHVTGMNLSKRALTGTIPPELGLYERSTSLYIDANFLSGTIPTELASMKKLVALSLKDNNLAGRIPSHFGSLSQMTKLDLASNDLIGVIPSELGSLRQLVDLRLAANFFSGPIPSELGSLKQLNTLDLSFNFLPGALPPLDLLQHLTSCSLSYNYFTGTIITELGSFRNLTTLTLAFNALTGKIPSELGSLQQLTILDAAMNALTGTIPSELGLLTRLQSLHLFQNFLTGIMPTELCTLPELASLRIDCQMVSCPVACDCICCDDPTEDECNFVYFN